MGVKSSRYERFCSSDMFATIVVSSAVFTDTFVYDLIVPFMPQMLEQRLHISRDQTQRWTSILLSVFGVTFLFATPAMGYLTDYVRSKRNIFLLGTVTMAAATLLFFLGDHVAIAAVARALQGLSAAIVWVSGNAFLTDHVDKSNLGWSMGILSAGMGAGELLGPIVGGPMYDHAGHFAVLGLVCGILGVDIVLRILLRDKPAASSDSTTQAEDVERPLLEEQHLNGEPVGYNGNEGSDMTAKQESTPPPTLNIFGWKFNRDLCASAYASVVTSIAMFALESTLPNFVSRNFGWTLSASGGVMFAYLFPSLFSPVVGKITARYGPRWFSVVMFLIMGAAFTGMGLLTDRDQIAEICFTIVVVFVGISTASMITIHTVAFSVAAKEQEERTKTSDSGKSFGSLYTAWAIGMAFGPLVADLFLENTSWLTMCIFFHALAWTSAVVMAFTWRRWENPAGVDG